MSKQREALQMALDALRGWIGIDEWIWPVTAKETCKKNSLEAITAIREALAEQEPARKPLTDAEMRHCANAMDAEPLAEGWKELIKFARAIERAHGITE